MSSMLSDRKSTLREKANTAMERLDKTENRLGDIEQNHARLAMGVNQVLNQAFNETAQVKEIVEGMIDLLGDVLKPEEGSNSPTFFDALQLKLKQRLMKRQADDATKVKNEIDQQVTEGKLVAVESAGEGCLLTGVEYDSGGVLTHPGYVAISWDKLKAEYKDQLLGKNVGYKLTTDTGAFEIVQILQTAPKQEESAQA
jgi:hypothetical protein